MGPGAREDEEPGGKGAGPEGEGGQPGRAALCAAAGEAGGVGARTGLVLRFGLEGGAYATMAIRELMKTGTGYNAHYANMMKGAPKSTSGAPKFASGARLRASAHGNTLARTQRRQRTRRACASSAELPPAAALRLVPSPARLCCLIFLFVGARVRSLSLARARRAHACGTWSCAEQASPPPQAPATSDGP